MRRHRAVLEFLHLPTPIDEPPLNFQANHLQLFARKSIYLIDDEMKQSVDREWNILRELKHRHIVQYEAFDTQEMSNGISVARLYMEYCEGGDLYMYIQSQKMRQQRSREPARPEINIAASASRAGPQRDNDGSEQPEALIWTTLLQLSSALAYCHYGIPNTQSGMSRAPDQTYTRGICHRDLTPSNGKAI